MLTLGDLISKLMSLPTGTFVFYDFCGLRPTTEIGSYRGIYAHLSIGWTDTGVITVEQLVEALVEADGQTYDGYKGGKYTMSKDTPVWVARSGCADATAIVDVRGTYIITERIEP